MNKLRRMLIFGGKGGYVPPTPPTPTDKTLMGLKVSKSVSRYATGSTVSTSDIVCKAVYTDGTNETVTPTLDTSGVSTSSVSVQYIGVSYGGLSGNLPITIYDAQAVDDNLLQLDDGEIYGDNIHIMIKDNIIYLDGSNYSASNNRSYLKYTNGLEYAPGKINSAWKSESVDSIISGNTYSFAMFVLSGTVPSGLISAIRDSGDNTILSASNTPQTVASDGAYGRLYWGSLSTFDKVAIGIKVVSGSTAPTVWTPSGQDEGIEISIGITDTSFVRLLPKKNYKSGLLDGTDYTVMQGIAYHNGYLYCGISKTTGPGNMEYVLAKFDMSTGELIGTSSTDRYLGHCNGVAYCNYDGYLHCVSLDEYGTIYRVDTNLNYIDSYTIDLSDRYAQFSGIGNIAYDATKEKFVYLLKGDNKKYAIYSKTRVFESLNDVTAQTGTYGGVLTDDKYIYQAVYRNSNNNFIYRYDWNLNFCQTIKLDTSGELETLTWIDGLLKYNSSSGNISQTPLPKETIS